MVMMLIIRKRGISLTFPESCKSVWKLKITMGPYKNMLSPVRSGIWERSAAPTWEGLLPGWVVHEDTVTGTMDRNTERLDSRPTSGIKDPQDFGKVTLPK